jgi:hypothetical protein
MKKQGADITNITLCYFVNDKCHSTKQINEDEELKKMFSNIDVGAFSYFRNQVIDSCNDADIIVIRIYPSNKFEAYKNNTLIHSNS